MGPFRRRKQRHLVLGRRGERVAAAVLRELGMDILARNVSAGRDEIDIVARHESTLCFVEVKTRRKQGFYSPAKAVGREKQRHIIRAGKKYLHKLGDPRLVVRYDVVEIIMPGLFPRVVHVWPGAFTGSFNRRY
ncbi:MAG: YraN family protein [Lentisphaeria bacterium]|nr:YraN family protein [Lentisphaeria bacterium]